ncbi:class I SAM-dependent methyltransferase [Actinopolymorpha sp. B17G11]|uniref:class I SAM-dependent methyltransferase n=1 Tax=Actinopolymorpha sp. B17G11 TaxID=3160861 RepID=UPI0032E49EFC
MGVADKAVVRSRWLRWVPGWARPALRTLRRQVRDILAGGRWQTEAAKLRRSWAKLPAETLDDYLVSGYQNPRINAQSILARHFLLTELFGSEFEPMMREELEFCVDANAALRRRAGELGVAMSQYTDPEKRAAVKKVCAVIADREGTYERKWSKALAGREADTLRVLEFACGSANDYRFLDAYGIARFLDYTGVDLNEDNIRNARQRFPVRGATVRFELGSILDLPYADDSVDYVLAFDIFEHLSLPAMHKAMNEAIRIARKGVVIAFFIMVDKPDHIVRPKDSYHWNELSAGRIQELLKVKFPTVRAIHIPTFLAADYGAEHSYNPKAWTVIAERPAVQTNTS